MHRAFVYPLADAVLLGPATLLVLAGRSYPVVGVLLALFWLAHLPRLVASRWELGLNAVLLALSGLTVLVYTTQPRGPASEAAFWGLLLHAAVVRAGADWPWRAGRNQVLGSGLALATAGLVALAFVGTDWKLNRGLLPAGLARAIRHLPHLVTSVQSSHGARPGLPNNEVAGVVAPLVLLPLAWLLFRRARWSALPALVLLAGAVLVELMADSRSALAGIALGALCLLALRSRRATVLAVALVVVTLQVDTIVRAVATPGAPRPGHQNSLDARQDIWQHGLTFVRQHPLTGIGINRFAEAYLADPGNQHNDGEDPASHAHDFFLQLALDLGIGGPLLFGCLLAFAGAGLAAGRRSLPRSDRWLLAALAAGTVAALVFGLTDEVAPGAKAGVLFWLELGLLAGGSETAVQRTMQRKPSARWYYRAGTGIKQA